MDEELANGSAPSDMRGIFHLSDLPDMLSPEMLDGVNKRLGQPHRPTRSDGNVRAPETEAAPVHNGPETVPPAQPPPDVAEPQPVVQPPPTVAAEPPPVVAPPIIDGGAGAHHPTDSAAIAGGSGPTLTPDQPKTAADVEAVLKGRFRLVEVVGERRSSRIFKAMDLSRVGLAANEPIAVEVMTQPFLESDEAYAALLSCVRALSGLQHPNIVRVFDCHRDESLVFITMELLVGEPLSAKLQTAPATPPLGGVAAESVIGTIADALIFAHQHNVVHGSLTLNSVIVGADQHLTLIDFSVAHWLTRPKTAVERREAAGHRLVAAVAPHNGSPQIMGRQKPDATDDVYALACMAYQLLTGWHPFDDGTGAQTLRFPPPKRPGLSSDQYAALVKALEFERASRTQTVAEFVGQMNPPITQKKAAKWPFAIGAALVIVLILVTLGLYGRREKRPPAAVQNPVAASPAEHVTPAIPPATASNAFRPGSVFRDCPACLRMVVLPVGQFEQGSAGKNAASNSTDWPQRLVTIPRPFAMSVTDVTVGQFEEFAKSTQRTMAGCDTYDGKWKQRADASWESPGFEQDAANPVVCISWRDAVAYADWLSQKSGHRYRLPSASEWEYAARAGGPMATPWGSADANACLHANVADESAARRYPGWSVFACDDGNVHTAHVGSFAANGFGLNDMLGNVFVWTQDCWHRSYAGAPTDGSARTGGDCKEHELRGGSWFTAPQLVTAARRNHFADDYRSSTFGLRLVRELE